MGGRTAASFSRGQKTEMISMSCELHNGPDLATAELREGPRPREGPGFTKAGTREAPCFTRRDLVRVRVSRRRGLVREALEGGCSRPSLACGVFAVTCRSSTESYARYAEDVPRARREFAIGNNFLCRTVQILRGWAAVVVARGTVCPSLFHPPLSHPPYAAPPPRGETSQGPSVCLCLGLPGAPSRAGVCRSVPLRHARGVRSDSSGCAWWDRATSRNPWSGRGSVRGHELVSARSRPGCGSAPDPGHDTRRRQDRGRIAA
jgi:hypothetical protein